MEKDLPSIDYLHERLRYEPETGKLFWREHESVQRSWNTRWSGKEAFTALQTNGYLQGAINWKRHYSHRVIWAMVWGSWPLHQIDHIDGNKSNNRIENLRDVTPSVNRHNSKKNINNTSGFTGVIKDKKKWRATITIYRKKTHLGCFNNIEDAATARHEASQNHGFTKRHGT